MVFSKEWFVEHQTILLRFANTHWGRYVLRIHGDRSSVGNAKIIKIEPNAIWWDDKVEFRTHDKFAKRLYHAFKPLWWLMHGWDFVFGRTPLLNFGFDTLTAYPEATEIITSDGAVSRSGTNLSWSSVHDGAANNTFLNSSTTGAALITSGSASNTWNELKRSQFLFDTTLEAGSVATAATLSLWGTSKSDGLGISPAINVYSVTTASNTTIYTSDYNNYGTTAYATAISYASWTTGAYNVFTLNSSGVAAVAETGITKYGVRESNYDATNIAPAWSASLSSFFSCYFAEQTGTSNDPKLVVTYTPPQDVTVTSGIASAQAFGTAQVARQQFITMTGIASAEAFGTATMAQGNFFPTSIASAEAFGTAAFVWPQNIEPTSIASAETFGELYFVRYPYPTTDYVRSSKTATSYTDPAKITTDYTDPAKPTTGYTKSTKPTTPYGEPTKPTTTYGRD